MMNLRYILFLITSTVGILSFTAFSEDKSTITIPPLFEYPTAPDDVDGLPEKSEWLMQHFWDKLDTKAKSVDQTALNHAFSVYVVPMRFASERSVNQSIENLLKRIKKNTGLLVQFTIAAEACTYSPKAEVWIDEVYIPFLKAAISSKKMPDARKLRWANQLTQLQNTLIGNTMPEIKTVDRTGNEGLLRPGDQWTIIEFGDPGCYDCRHGRLKMESNAPLQAMVRSGQAAIYFLIPDAESSWSLDTLDYPKNWTVAAVPDAEDVLDLRVQPSVYVLNPEGKIEAKNIPVAEAIKLVVSKKN